MTMTTDRAPVTGALWALFASVAFSAVDVTVKFLSSDYPHYQLTFLRTLVALAVLIAVIAPFSGGLRALGTRRLKVHLLRGACVVFANLCFFLALAAMPLAEAVAIFFLGETVGPFRWAAIAVGLLGVVIVLRPGMAAFQPAAILPILAATGYGMLHILTRRIGDTDGASAMVFWSQIVMLAVALVAGIAFGNGRFDVFDHPSLSFLFRAWAWPTPFDAGLIAALGVTITFAGYAISEAYRRSEPAFIAPIEYVALPLSVAWGIFLFDEWPDAVALTGIALILTSGLVLVWREAVARRSGEVDMPDRI